MTPQRPEGNVTLPNGTIEIIRSFESRYEIGSSDSWQLFELEILRVERSEDSGNEDDAATEAIEEVNAIQGQNAQLTINFTLNDDQQVSYSWIIDQASWRKVPVLIPPNNVSYVMVQLRIPYTAVTTVLWLTANVATVERGVDYSHMLVAVVNGSDAPNLTVRGRDVRIPNGASVIESGEKQGLLNLPDDITPLSGNRVHCADPVWCALDILLEVFGYTLDDIDYDAFFRVSRTIKNPVHAKVAILPSPIETVKPLLNTIESELVQRNGIFTFDRIDMDSIQFTFGKGHRSTNVISEVKADVPLKKAIITFERDGYLELQRFDPNGEEPLGDNSLPGSVGVETLPYQRNHRDAILRGRELLWPKETEIVKVTFGPKADILRIGDRIYFETNAPTILEIKKDTGIWILTLDAPFEGVAAYVERNPLEAEVELIDVFQGTSLNTITTTANSGEENAYVVGSAVINADFALPYRVINISKDRALGYSVVLEREDDPQRIAWLDAGTCDNRFPPNPLPLPPIPIEEGAIPPDQPLPPDPDVTEDNVPPIPPIRRIPEFPELTPPPPIQFLSVDNITVSTADLLLNNVEQASTWRYTDVNRREFCGSVFGFYDVGRPYTRAQLIGLEPDTEYTYAAYRYVLDAGCDDDLEIDRITFRTLAIERVPPPLPADSYELKLEELTDTTATVSINPIPEIGLWTFHLLLGTTGNTITFSNCPLSINKFAFFRYLTPSTEFTVVAFDIAGCDPRSEVARLTFTTLGSGENPNAPRLRLINALDTVASVELLNAPRPDPNLDVSARWRYSLALKGGERFDPYRCRLAIESIVGFEGLTPNTTYTATAYAFRGTFSDDCETDNVFDTLDFTTTGVQEDPYLTVQNVTGTTATLFITNWQSAWQLRGTEARFKVFISPSIPDGDTQITLESLIPGTLYDLGAFQLSNGPRITPNVQFTTTGTAPVPKLSVVRNENISRTSSTVVMAITNAPLATIGGGAGNILWYYTITSGASTSTLTCNRRGDSNDVTFQNLVPSARYTVRGYRQGQELSNSCSNSNNEFDVLQFTAAAAKVEPTLTLVGDATTTSQRVRINDWRNAWQVRTVDQNDEALTFPLVRAGITEYLIENLKANTRYTATAYGSTTTTDGLTEPVTFTTQQIPIAGGDRLYTPENSPNPFPNGLRSSRSIVGYDPNKPFSTAEVSRADRPLEYLWYGLNRNPGVAGVSLVNALADIAIRTRFFGGMVTLLRVAYYSILTMYGMEIMYGDLTKPRGSSPSYLVEFQSNEFKERYIVLPERTTYNVVKLVGRLAPSSTYKIHLIGGGRDAVGSNFDELKSGETLVAEKTITTPSIDNILNPLIRSSYFGFTFGIDIEISQPKTGDRSVMIMNLKTDRAAVNNNIQYYLEANARPGATILSRVVDTNGVSLFNQNIPDADWTLINVSELNIRIPSVIGRYYFWLRVEGNSKAFLAVVISLAGNNDVGINAHKPYPQTGNVVRSCIINPIDTSPVT